MSSNNNTMTSYRIIDSKPQPNYTNNRIWYNGNITHFTSYSSTASTIIEEYLRGTEIKMIQIHQLNAELPSELLNNQYQNLRRLEIKCYFDTDLVFRIVSGLPSLKILRFGSSSFIPNNSGASPPPNHSKMEMSSSVEELLISFDYQKFKTFKSSRRNEVRLRLKKVLEYSSKHLHNLQKIDLTLPLETESLETFLTAFPTIRANGRETKDYANQIVFFKSGYPVRMASNRRTGPDDGVYARADEPQILQVDLADDDDDSINSVHSDDTNPRPGPGTPVQRRDSLELQTCKRYRRDRSTSNSTTDNRF